MKLIELLAQERVTIPSGTVYQNNAGYIYGHYGAIMPYKKYPLCEDCPTATVTRTELELFKCRGYKVKKFYDLTIESFIADGLSFEQLKERDYIEKVKTLSEFFDDIPKLKNCRCKTTPIELPNSIALESVPQHPFTFRHKSAEVTFTDFKDLRDLIEVILK